MTRWVLSGSETQYGDYWLMIPEVLSPGGGLRLSGLFEFSNDHLVAVPKLAYWVNVQLWHGSNRTLGLFVVAVVAAQVGLLLVLLSRSTIGVAGRIGVTAAASGLLFSPLGAWNFLKSMSGTAWLTANLFVLGAITLRVCGKRWLPSLLAAAACASYGSALAVWPALLVLGWLVDRRLLRQWPVVASGVVVVTGFLALRSRSDSKAPPIASPIDILRYGFEVVGGGVVRFDSPHSGLVGGVVVAAVAVGFAGSIVTRQLVWAAPWMAIALFGLGASMIVALGRAQSFFSFGSNRHASLGALALIGAIGLWCTVLSSPVVRELAESRVHALVLPAVTGALGVSIALATLGFSRAELDRMRATGASQDELAISLRFDLAEGNTVPLGGFAAMPRGLEELLASANHLPFSEHPGVDCGLAGRTVPMDLIDQRLPYTIDARTVGVPDSRQTALVGRGWLRDPQGQVRCVVVLDREREVIGAGAVGPVDRGYGGMLGSPPGADGFVTVQPIGTAAARVYLVLDDGRLALVPRPQDVIGWPSHTAQSR